MSIYNRLNQWNMIACYYKKNPAVIAKKDCYYNCIARIQYRNFYH